MSSINGKFQVVFRTSGFAKAYVSTTGNAPFVLTSGKKVIYAATTGNSPIVLTSGNKTSFFQTTSSWPIVKTPGAAVAFVVTPNPNPIKDLYRRISLIFVLLPLLKLQDQDRMLIQYLGSLMASHLRSFDCSNHLHLQFRQKELVDKPLQR